jgi:hypothetical protein
MQMWSSWTTTRRSRTAPSFVGVDDVILIRYDLEFIPSGLVNLTVMEVPESGRIFLGGQRRSCVVDLAAKSVEHVFEHCLCWGFSRDSWPNVVLETGELDCLWRALDGRILGHVSVDPPWEMHSDERGVRSGMSPGRPVLARSRDSS